MPCFHPIPASQDMGKVRLHPPIGEANLQLPCGTCIGCKVQRATQWGLRAQHEASMWQHNSFVTLTYDDEHLPADNQLQPADLRNFLKRLRRAAEDRRPGIATDHTRSIRYLASGEYGERNGRPHYHLCLFNCNFSDSYQVAKRLRESPALAKLWPDGKHKLGTVTAATATYVAKYSAKQDPSPPCDGDGVVRQKPFLRMSLRPALGLQWIQKFKNDLAQGYIASSSTKGTTLKRIPRYYMQYLQKTDALFAEAVQHKQLQRALTHEPQNLEAAEQILVATLNQKARTL